jgi:thiol-disulfide isomerase/thioredoxin
MALKIRYLFLIVFFALIHVSYGADVKFQELKERTDFKIDDIYSEEGTIATLTKYKGSNLVVNIWATWCPTCVKELPELEKMANKLHTKNIKVILISQDDDGIKSVKKYLDKLNIKSLDRLYDPNNNATKQLGIRGLPTTLIINKEGSVVGKYEGAANWSSDSVISEIQHAIKQ